MLIYYFNQLSDLSKNAFTALGGKSLGRIDIKMDYSGVPHFIEANLMPGLRKGYFYRSCLLNLNMSYEQMILTVADNGLSSQRIHFQSTKLLKGHPATEPRSLETFSF